MNALPDEPADALLLAAAAPPAGFRRVGRFCGRFIEHSGPVFGRLAGNDLTLGFRVLERHTNPLDCSHGGMLASLADILLAASAMYRPEAWGRIVPTVSLQMDFLAPARRGSWVQGRADILKTTGSFIFSQALIESDGDPVLRASGLLKLGPAPESVGAWDPLEIL